MTALQQVKTTSNAQVLPYRQSTIRAQEAPLELSLSKKNYERVLGGGFQWQLLEYPFHFSPNWKICTVAADL